jgi:hypothetical protein
MTEEPHDDQDIADLLSQLGQRTPDYPANLLEQRRAAYQQDVAALGLGLAAGAAVGAGVGAAKVWTIQNVLTVIVSALLLAGALGAILLFQDLITPRNPLIPGQGPALTLTLTATPLATLTPSATPTSTGPAIATATLVAQSTQRPIPTGTGLPLGQTATPTGTLTSTPTGTPTPTPTGTRTSTPTDAPTPTPTGTPVTAPTDTPTPTGTPITVPTDTPTPTGTPTTVPTHTPTPTSTPTNTATPTPGEPIQRPSIQIEDVAISSAENGSPAAAGSFVVQNASGGGNTFVTINNVTLSFTSRKVGVDRTEHTATCTLAPNANGYVLAPGEAASFQYMCTLSPAVPSSAREITAEVTVGTATNQLGEVRGPFHATSPEFKLQ